MKDSPAELEQCVSDKKRISGLNVVIHSARRDLLDIGELFIECKIKDLMLLLFIDMGTMYVGYYNIVII